MKLFELTLICSAFGAIVAWLWSLHKVKMMEYSLDTATCKIQKRTEALHNLEKLIENSILVFSQLENFAQNTIDWMAIIRDIENKDSHFVYANPAMAETLGYTQDELIDRPWRDFLAPRSRELIDLDEIDSCGGVSEYVCKDGSMKLFSVSSCPADEEGYVYAVFREIK